MDVLSASSNALVDVSWFENLDGEGTFGAKQIITTDIEGIATVTAADMDNDGAIDVLSTSYNEGKIAWYRNSTILNTDVFLTTSLKVYPNPAKTVLNIQLESGEIDIVVIYNMRGVEVLTKNKNVQQINIENLSNGIYFLKVYSNQKRLR